MSAHGNTYQKQFIRMAIRRLPHHTALHVAAKLHNRPLLNHLNKYAKRRIIGHPKLPTFSQAEQDRYRQVTASTKLWHGTGRYQHAPQGTTDVLHKILQDRALLPAQDAYAVFSGGQAMTSTSLTPLRIIARCYGDMHGKGHKEPNRYGDALTWVSYYYGLFYARLYTAQYWTVKRHYANWHRQTHDAKGHNTWGKKANQSAQDVWDVFGLGSDIAGNYPIVIGVRAIADTIPLSKIFSDCEVRVGRAITWAEITHLEVPLSKVAEVQAMLAKNDLTMPVEPIELGEWVADQQPFSKLLGLHGS